MIKVSLLSHTPNPDDVVTASARLCYSDESAMDILEHTNEKTKKGLIKHLFKSGHTSTFEHASFTFAIEGISRNCSHQLVRHRVASYSQKSQRYNTESFSDDNVIYPEPIKKASDEIKQLYYSSFKRSFDDYQKLLDMGIKKEDARYVLPHGWETKIVVTMNARSLHHFFNLRLCSRSQTEIQELAKHMLIEVRKVAPILFEKAGPDCLFGQCNESNSCGKPYKNMDDLLR
jgi:thymidylate synthase (FAD)